MSGRMRRGLLATAACLASLFSLAAHASADTFAEPAVRATGPEQIVFDWSRDNCGDWDIPDQPARAFRDDQNRVQMLYGHYDARRGLGSSLDTVRHQCPLISTSHRNPDPAQYDAQEWISAPYTLDGRTIYGVVHMEYRGWVFGTCTNAVDLKKCWWNALTFTKSTDAGATYQHPAPPGQMVATNPNRFVPGEGPYGMFTPSNIVHRPTDGYYYMMARGEDRVTLASTCLMRTKDLNDPKSWRAWDGEAFRVRFADPYRESIEPRSAHLCHEVGRPSIGSMSESLTFSTYFNKFMLVGAVGGGGLVGNEVEGVYFSLSDDLIHWSPRRLLMATQVMWSHTCGEPDPMKDPSLLDPTSTSRNFETISRNPYLYLSRLHLSPTAPCPWGQDRDLVRIPVQFTGTVPEASFTDSPDPALIGQTVTFNASGSSDPGGNPITKYEWDLDGNGSFERDTGTNPVTTMVATRVRSDKVGLRVTDSEGFTDQVERRLTVDAKINFQPNVAPIPAGGYRKDIGASYKDSRGWGWVRQDSLSSASHVPLDMRTNTRDRDLDNVDAYDQKLDTFVYMQFPYDHPTIVETPGAWEMAVPCGTYSVTVSMGDSAYSSTNTPPQNVSKHRINMEGEAVIKGWRPTDANKFRTISKTIHVCDGRLTVDAIGGSNTKLNYVEVKRVESKVNFQQSTGTIPAPYQRDIGAAYTDARGFGWVRQDTIGSLVPTPLDLLPNPRDRDLTNVDQYPQRLDTWIYMQFPYDHPTFVETPGAWEMALPCGTYTVTVSVGDSAFTSSSTALHDISTHRINLEGENVIAGFKPTDATKFQSATKTLSVCDGRLTIDAIGGVNTKLNYVDIIRAD
jgi:hypothetical protein